MNADIFRSENTFHLLLVLKRTTPCGVDMSVIVYEVILVHKVKEIIDFVRGEGFKKYFITIG